MYGGIAILLGIFLSFSLKEKYIKKSEPKPKAKEAF